MPQIGPYLHINAANCLHCKIGEINDLARNIKRIQFEGDGEANCPN
ncbi:4Fe-4S dicluster domain-containing protein [Vibrio navarrensis]|uniref:4Fe-4S dicluster domain-containing protein n=1 Tax=Vibrio navarrensis TaxID=29495 RepID=A0AAJ4LW53_9VIBR|nr:4Fe-4S dicluster domain-containing protein [Vibrio navarrensis]